MFAIAVVVFVQHALSRTAFIDDVIRQKNAMKESYHLDFKFEGKDPHTAPGLTKAQSFSARIWRSGNKLRVDVSDRKQDNHVDERYSAARHVICVNCEREHHFISTTIDPDSSPITSLVEFKPLKSGHPDIYGLDLDWRYLGLSNTRLAVNQRLEIAKGYGELKANPTLRVDTEVRGGVRCSVSTVTNGAISRTWFADPARGNPILFETTWEKDGKAKRHATEVKWQSTAGGHMYPQIVKNVQLVDGVVHHEEQITVTHADFHTPVDPAVFTLAGLGLKDNQPVAYPGLDLSRMPRWRDGKADESLSDEAQRRAQGSGWPTDVVASSVAAAYPTESRTPLILSIVSGTLAVAALVVAFLYRRRKVGA